MASVDIGHPTLTKQAELAFARWKKAEPHDKLSILTVVSLLLMTEVIVFDEVSTGLEFIRPMITTPVILVIPGFLILALLGIDLHSPERFAYAVLTSIVTLMTGGFLLNAFTRLQAFPISQPFSSGVLIPSFCVLVVGLVTAIQLRQPRVELPSIDFESISLRVVTLSLSLLCLSVFGATALKSTGQNIFLLSLFVLIALSAVVVTELTPNQTTKLIFLYCISAALLLQKTLATYYQHTGDGPKEFYFSNLVLANGVWNPAFSQPKNGMLSLVIYYPVHSIVSNLDLILVYKIVYPLIFSLVTIVLYSLYQRQIGEELAFVATLLVLFLHTYFVILAGSTRTGIGILFAAALLTINTNGTLARRQKVVFSLLFGCGLVVGYYAVAVIFIGVFGLMFASNITIPRFTGIRQDKSPLLSLPFVFLLGVISVSWYIHTTSSGVFSGIVLVLYSMVERVTEILTLRYSAAGHAVTSGPQSLTFSIIRFEFIFLTLLIGIGGLIGGNYVFRNTLEQYPLLSRLSQLLTSVQPERLSLSSLYLYASAGMVSLLVLAFAPISAIGIGRIYTIALIVLSPIAVLGAVSCCNIVGRFSRGIPIKTTVLALVLGLVLLVNSGVLATAVTHDTSPQPQLEDVDKDLTLEDLSIYHKYHYYQNVQTASWYSEYRTDNLPVYGPGFREVLPLYYFHEEYDETGVKPPGNYQRLPSNGDLEKGYVFIGGYSDSTGQVIIGRGESSTDYGAYDVVATSQLRNENNKKIYTTGRSKSYLR